MKTVVLAWSAKWVWVHYIHSCMYTYYIHVHTYTDIHTPPELVVDIKRFRVLYFIKKLLMSRFQVSQFYIVFMMLCHVTQRNIAYKSWSGKEAIVASYNSVIGNYCQRIKWLHMKLVKTKVISSHLCVFSWRIVQVNFFTIMKYTTFSFANYDHSGLHQLKS